MDFFLELSRSFRIADALDIALISVFLYSVLSWFRETTSRNVVLGISVLGFTYFAARAFDLYMTTRLFQAVFAVFLVAMVVVFQEDLRRAFEQIATWGNVRHRQTPGPEAGHLDILAETATELASKRVGGLIVLKGSEPLERHIDAGIPIDARISKPLLDSIFDPHSMGHDGAVIVRGDRIEQFAVHLPLSKNLQELGRRGTRHSAALGLSERTDALVIVISEERGQVSIAKKGKLTPIDSPAALKSRLERFWQFHFLPQKGAIWARIVKEHAVLKVVSVFMACIAWFFVSYEPSTIQQTFVIPIEFRNVPKNLVMDDTAPTEARVTLAGYERGFNLLAPSALKVSIDLGSIEEGYQQIPIEDSDIKGMANLEVYRIEPRVLRFLVSKPQVVSLAVRVPIEGALPSALSLIAVKPSPERIQVVFWQRERYSTDTISTESIDLSKVAKSRVYRRKLKVPDHARLGDGVPSEVQVSVEVAEKAP